jgi:hypothetical protein
MRALQDIDVNDCDDLALDWLPASSAMAVRTLDISRTGVVQLPDGMRALKKLVAISCDYLSATWLPASSAAALRTLDIHDGS